MHDSTSKLLFEHNDVPILSNKYMDTDIEI